MRTLTLAATALLLASAAATADTPAAAPRSTGNVESHVEAAPAPAAEAATKFQEPVQVAFAAGETRRLVQGKVTAANPAVILWSAPMDQMLNAQLMVEGPVAALVIFQPGADKPEAGTTLADGAIRWIGAAAKAGELRLEVHGKSAEEVSFKLGVEVVPDRHRKP